MEDNYVIDQVSWHTGVPGNPEVREQVVRRFFIISNFLQSNGLSTREPPARESDIGDDFNFHSSDLTDEGLVVMKAAYDKWLSKVDVGMPPENLTLLQNAIKLARGA